MQRNKEQQNTTIQPHVRSKGYKIQVIDESNSIKPAKANEDIDHISVVIQINLNRICIKTE